MHAGITAQLAGRLEDQRGPSELPAPSFGPQARVLLPPPAALHTVKGLQEELSLCFRGLGHNKVLIGVVYKAVVWLIGLCGVKIPPLGEW